MNIEKLRIVSYLLAFASVLIVVLILKHEVDEMYGQTAGGFMFLFLILPDAYLLTSGLYGLFFKKESE